jgi:integrase
MSALPAISLDRVQAVIDLLPALPLSVRYFDDFVDKYRCIRDLSANHLWLIETDGLKARIDFTGFGPFSPIMKHVFVDLLTRLDPASVSSCYYSAKRLVQRFDAAAVLGAMLLLEPFEYRAYWVNQLLPTLIAEEARALKAFLQSLCNLHLGSWRSDYSNYASLLPLPKADAYRIVRTGECFVPLDQQSLVIDYFDELTALITASPQQISTDELRDACILLVTFQHAFRPGQVARIRTADVRVHGTGAVHFSTLLTKKRMQSQRVRVNRRIKREWCPVFIEYRRRRDLGIALSDDVPDDSFFGLIPSAIGDRLQKLMQQVTGEDWTSTDLRHTAAQRLADAGVSHIGLSEFMGHSSIRTANVYFDTSPTQAQRVNQALGISPVYSTVVEVARTRTIDKGALLRLPPDQQIGGVPHGIPISGIGGCMVGQSLCSKNPILSCYTCRKFMPVRDTTIHRQVTEDLRPVVHEFAGASRGNDVSPAYTQLRLMLTAAERVIADIESGESAQ